MVLWRVDVSGFDASAGKQLHVRLAAPDGLERKWNPVTLTHEVSTVILRNVRASSRGNWTIECRNRKPSRDADGRGVVCAWYAAL